MKGPGDEYWQDVVRVIHSEDHVVVFADDFSSAVPGGECRVTGWVAWIVKPGMYHQARLGLERLLAECPVETEELHAKELAGPDKNSPWRGTFPRVRWDHFKDWAELLFPCVDQVYFFAMREDDYQDLQGWLKYSPPAPAWANFQRFERGVQFYFIEEVLKSLYEDYPENEFIFVLDNNHNRRDVAVKVMNTGSRLYRDCIYFFDSKSMKGLQYADLLAYAHSRLLVEIDRHQRGQQFGMFADVLTGIVNALEPVRVDLLKRMLKRIIPDAD